jgi:hypothetical protein
VPRRDTWSLQAYCFARVPAGRLPAPRTLLAAFGSPLSIPSVPRPSVRRRDLWVELSVVFARHPGVTRRSDGRCCERFMCCRINGEPGGNRTHNPQIKSSLPQVKTLNKLNDFSRQLCRTLQITATRRNPDATKIRTVLECLVTLSISFPHSGIEAEIVSRTNLDPLEARVCRIEHVIAFRRDDDRRHGQRRRRSFDDPRPSQLLKLGRCRDLTPGAGKVREREFFDDQVVWDVRRYRQKVCRREVRVSVDEQLKGRKQRTVSQLVRLLPRNVLAAS